MSKYNTEDVGISSDEEKFNEENSDEENYSKE